MSEHFTSNKYSWFINSLLFIFPIVINSQKVAGDLILFILAITGLFITFFYKTSNEFKFKIDRMLLKTFLINKIIEYCTLSRFLSTLSALLKSGIALVEALRISEDIVTNEVIKEILEIGDTLCGYILIIDALKLTFRKVKLNKRSDCYCNEKK